MGGWGTQWVEEDSGGKLWLLLRGSPPAAPRLLAMLLRLLLAFLAPRLLAMLLPRLLAMLLWLLRPLLALLAPRLLAMLLRQLPVWEVPTFPCPQCHGEQPVRAKPSRCPLRLEPVAIEEAMTTDVSKRRYQMVLL